MKEKILIIASDAKARAMLTDILMSDNYEVLQAKDGKEGIKAAKENDLNLVLLNLKLPDINGLAALKEIINEKPALPIVIISKSRTTKDAILASKIGAEGWLGKLSDREKVLLTVQKVIERGKIQRENAVLREEAFYIKKVILSQYKQEIIALKEKILKKFEMVGVSEMMRKISRLIEEVAGSKATVLITGESGVGKELVARAIHNKSDRVYGPFVKINCAAIPENLIESELFGHEKGAFTGAISTKKGKLEIADKGTIFLDEIGDLVFPAQAKLLRFLQESEFERVGGTDTIKVDVRIITATNKNLKNEIASKNFREDLFYRLNVISIYVPPLRERTQDIPHIADYFLEKYCEENGVPKKNLTSEAIDYLKNQPWKGNIRELENLIARTSILVKSNEIKPNDLLPMTLDAVKIRTSSTLKEATEEFQKEFILKVLAENDWNKAKTAEKLDIGRAHLYRKMRDLGIEI